MASGTNENDGRQRSGSGNCRLLKCASESLWSQSQSLTFANAKRTDVGGKEDEKGSMIGYLRA